MTWRERRLGIQPSHTINLNYPQWDPLAPFEGAFSCSLLTFSRGGGGKIKVKYKHFALKEVSMQNTKSATTAGLLGLFLGAFGGHNWYLGDNKKGIIHCSMAGAGILLVIIGNILYNNAISSFSGIMALYGGGFVWQSILMLSLIHI